MNPTAGPVGFHSPDRARRDGEEPASGPEPRYLSAPDYRPEEK
jgi:hypothetical protein